MTKVYLDISTYRDHRIEVKFDYDPVCVKLIKEVPDAKFVNRNKPGGPYWHVPLDLQVCWDLRDLFGKTLRVSDTLKLWVRQETEKQNATSSILLNQTDTLDRLPQVLPFLSESLYPFQRVAVAFGAQAQNFLIADQPGLGKTLEAIGAVYEAENEVGAHLIIAPKVSLDTVWRRELERWATGPVYVMTGTKLEKEYVASQFKKDQSETKWLVTNPETVRFKKKKKGKLDARTMEEATELEPRHAIFTQIHWNTIVIDECHKGAVRNPSTITAQSLFQLEGNMKIALSGTPMKNRGIDLWGVLHYLEPDKYPSKWAWAKRYCEILVTSWGQKIQGIRPEMEEELWKTLASIMIRRKKNEVFKELPEKMYVDVWCDMTPVQKKQYEMMQKDSLLRLGDKTMFATSVLTELLRLRQFAIAYYSEATSGNSPINPTEESGKLQTLREMLDERGIFDDDVAYDEDREKVIVFSQFSQVVDMVASNLSRAGAEVAVITGKFSGLLRGRERVALSREEVMSRFQEHDGPNVIVMTTTAGGVAITLDRADSVFFMDETWSPADMEQAEDRAHRVSRIHPVTVYTLRSRDTYDEVLFDILNGKRAEADKVLDAWREGLI